MSNARARRSILGPSLRWDDGSVCPNRRHPSAGWGSELRHLRYSRPLSPSRAPMLTAYLSLFASAFIAATLLPLQSEAVLVGLLLTGGYSPAALVLVATVGNVLGSLLNWVLGRGVERFRQRRWFPASPQQMARAQQWYQRYGCWTLLLSWLPVVGDPLTLVAGVMREPLWRFVLLVSIAKAGRYLVLAAVVLNLGSNP